MNSGPSPQHTRQTRRSQITALRIGNHPLNTPAPPTAPQNSEAVQKLQYLIDVFKTNPARLKTNIQATHRHTPPTTKTPLTKVKTGANEVMIYKDKSRVRRGEERYTAPDASALSAKTPSKNPDLDPDWRRDQDQDLMDLTAQLVEEAHLAAQNQASGTLFPSGAVAIKQEIDQLRAWVLDWASYGPGGKDIPSDTPLTRPQIRTLNDRISRLAAHKGVSITPLPLPPHTKGTIPPLRQKGNGVTKEAQYLPPQNLHLLPPMEGVTGHHP